MAHEPRPIGPAEASALLSGARGSADRDRLSDLLAAAAGGPLPHELRDRELVLAGFVRASQGEPAPSRPGRRAPRRWALRVVAPLAVVVLVSGFGVAARAGALPTPIQAAAHDVLFGAVPAPPESREPDGATAPPPTSDDESGPDADEVGERCDNVRRATRHGDPIDPEDLAALKTLAGGAERVAEFCDRQLSPAQNQDDPGDASSPRPTPTNSDDGGSQ